MLYYRVENLSKVIHAFLWTVRAPGPNLAKASGIGQRTNQQLLKGASECYDFKKPTLCLPKFKL